MLADAIARVWKDEAARIVGALTRLTRDVALAEELVQDALVAALEQWPRQGTPANPGAWLMTTAKNRALNHLQRAKLAGRVSESLAHEPQSHHPGDELEARMDTEVTDDVLRLVFLSCHPVLSSEARVALTLRLVCGLSTADIARAFLSTEPTIAQRLVRAKRTLGEAQVPFELPRGDELSPRLSSVLEVVYLVFNEGYSASAGEDLLRPALIDEARRLGRLVAGLAPNEPEVHALNALMAFQASRLATRVDAANEPVLLADQPRAQWDAAAIAEGVNALERARAVATAAGPYQLQAEIASCHARAQTTEATDWERIAALYASLAALRPSPVIELNRALAVSRAEGAAAGLVLLDALRTEPALARYPFLPAARAELLEQVGRRDEAREEFERASMLTENVKQRDRLKRRAAALEGLSNMQCR